MRWAPATVNTRLTTDLLFTDRRGREQHQLWTRPAGRGREAGHHGWRIIARHPAYVRRSILAMSLGQVQFQAIQQCLQGHLEFLLATVLAEQGAQPGDAGVAGQVDLIVFIGDLGVPFGQGYFDR